MASARKQGNWKREDLEKAVDDVNNHKLSLRAASAHYGVPVTTIQNYATGQIQIDAKPGPTPILTKSEEDELVKWALKMAEIGHGQT